ncbi:protein FAM83D [Oncorhynchus tshawytscha]|uniref:Scaffolding anchor of CK1 domain-containing protein n=1 Tax=Oncorhynchus tshawytscha TaxID=74940 RepID=A0A8C8JBX9_ONCTS|nr:protein FAM83D [Oncorhynchus tshawytscha]
MALSQCLEDSPVRWPSRRQESDLNVKELYNERHRLALEELISGGVDSFLGFLRRERIPNFLSDDEIRRIGRAAVVPRGVSLHAEDVIFEQSVSSSMDCSSVTYFPEVSDVEPPLLEIGWPAFTSGSYRGVTRAVAHFQPSYGECIYSCKEAARRMIQSAKEVIAIVTDSLTDLDIFKDLQEACTQRRVPVYILLDWSCVPAFLKMCNNVNVRLDDLKQMRVRTITGGTYFMRSGAKITGKVHERFMLIDGNRVTTGSYRFNWTDGKLNSSNMIELSGQITENFDEEFRILYAQSMPVITRGPASARNSGIYDHLLIKHPVTSSPQPGKERPPVKPVCLEVLGKTVCLTSIPSRAQAVAVPPSREMTGKSSPVSASSTIGEDWMEQRHMQELLAGSAAQCLPTGDPATATSAVDVQVTPSVPTCCHVSTQTSCPAVDLGVQTDLTQYTKHLSPNKATFTPITSTTTQTNNIQSEAAASSDSVSTSPRQHLAPHGVDRRPAIRHCTAPPDGNLRECFRKLTKERQYHYSTIRSKLEHMVTMLSHRRELVDLTNMALGPGLHRACNAQKERRQRQGHNPGLLMDSVGMGTWPRARCLH